MPRPRHLNVALRFSCHTWLVSVLPNQYNHGESDAASKRCRNREPDGIYSFWMSGDWLDRLLDFDVTPRPKTQWSCALVRMYLQAQFRDSCTIRQSCPHLPALFPGTYGYLTAVRNHRSRKSVQCGPDSANPNIPTFDLTYLSRLASFRLRVTTQSLKAMLCVPVELRATPTITQHAYGVLSVNPVTQVVWSCDLLFRGVYG